MNYLKFLLPLIFIIFLNNEKVSANEIVALNDTDSNVVDFSRFYNVKSEENFDLVQVNLRSALFSATDYSTSLLKDYPEYLKVNDVQINGISGKKMTLEFVQPLTFSALYLDFSVSIGELCVEFFDESVLRHRTYYNKGEKIYLPNSHKITKIVISGINKSNHIIKDYDVFVDPAIFLSSVIDLKEDLITDRNAVFTWKNPVHDLFQTVKVYLNDNLYTAGIMNSVNLKNLSPETNYVLKIVAVYDGAEVERIYQFKTKEYIDVDPPDNITNLNLIGSNNTVDLKFNASLSSDVSHYKIYRNNVLIKDNLNDLFFEDTSLAEDTTYIYKVTAVDLLGNENLGVSKSVKTLSSKDTIPPSDVLNLVVVEDYTQTNMRMSTFGIKQINALVTYDLPSDDDFSHVEILRNDKLLNSTVNSNRYMDLNIGEKQTYKYTVKSVDYSGNKSKGENVYLNTTYIPDTFAPAAPTGLNVSRNNSGGKLSWLKNNESDFDGYNVYVNGTKYNTDLVKTTSQVLKSLENGTTYQLTVTAVDWSGNESAHSAAIDLVPDKNASTDVNLSENYNLKDVADGTANWFASLWWIVAFVVGIALAFILGRRIKELFVGS